MIWEKLLLAKKVLNTPANTTTKNLKYHCRKFACQVDLQYRMDIAGWGDGYTENGKYQKNGVALLVSLPVIDAKDNQAIMR